MSRPYKRLATRPAPTRARLIHLLIEERANCLRWQGLYLNFGPSTPDDPRGGNTAGIGLIDTWRDQARREIEAEVLTPTEATP